MSIRVRLTASALAIALAMGGTAAQAQSITQALTAAYSYAPDLQSAVLDAKSRAENIVQAKSRKLPTIGASVNGTYNWNIAGGQFQDSTSLNAGLSYNQTLFDNFQTEAQIEAARAGAEAAEYQILNTEQNVLLNVVQAYMSVLSDRQLVGLRQENVNFYNTQLSSARDRLEVGEGTRIDVAQANARLAQGQAAFEAAVNSLEVSEATFQRYVGQAPRDLQSSHSFARLIPGSLQSAISEAESGHPAILTAKAAIRAAQAGSDAAQGAFGPTIDVTGSIGASNGTSSSGPGSSQAVSGQMRLNISVPIYAGGALGSGVRQANLDQIRSEVDAMSIYDQIREAVISAWAGIQNADAQITAARSAVSAGEEVVNGVIQERDLGTRTTLDVLNAQAELISAREALINASSSKVIATFSLLASIGRLTAGDLGLPVQTRTALNYTQEIEDVWQELRVVPDK